MDYEKFPKFSIRLSQIVQTYEIMNRKTISLLCAVLLIVGCGSSQSVKINEAARMEEETAENEAVTAYKRAIESISLENRYDVEKGGRWAIRKRTKRNLPPPQGITKRRETSLRWLRPNAGSD